jgi:hypothetical protein
MTNDTNETQTVDLIAVLKQHLPAPKNYNVQAPFGPARKPGETLAEYLNRYRGGGAR